MKSKIPDFLKEKLMKKYALTKNFPKEIQEFLLNYSIFYGWDITNIQTIFRLMQKGLTTLKKCEYVSCNNTQKIYETGKITSGCCKKHTTIINNLKLSNCEWSQQSEHAKAKRNYTNLRKFGTNNPMKNKDIVEKVKKTKKEKYGNPKYNNFEKMQETLLKHYGVTNPAYILTSNLKKSATCLERYGVKSPLESNEIKNKIIETNIKKFGVDNPLQNINIKNKSISTMLERYGVQYPSQNSDILEKIMKSSYRYRDYTWNTGEISKLQGFEPIVLQELEDQGYNFNDILTSNKDMPEIWYIFEGKKHRYYPDFYIPKENLIIEVKSQWTLELHKDKNQAKFQAVKEAGFNFRLEIR